MINRNQILLLAMSFCCTQLFAECNSSLASSNSFKDYVVSQNGTVVDKRTNLMWKQCTQGLSGVNCPGNPQVFTWSQALQEANNSNFAEFSDWRIPNVKELRSLVEYSCSNPSIIEEIFPNTRPWYYWSSTPYAPNDTDTWRVSFDHGQDFLHNRDGSYYVRLVRSIN